MSGRREATESKLTCPYCGGCRFKPQSAHGFAWCGTCYRVFAVSQQEAPKMPRPVPNGELEGPTDPTVPG